MSRPTAIAVALLGTAWVCACLVLAPMMVDWLAPRAVPTLARRAAADLPPRTARTPLGADRLRVPDLEAPRRIDLYGNEIANPVARYRVDDRGTLYEVHSPETEVPRLLPPRL